MQIDRIYSLTLKERPERKYGHLGGFHALRFPMHIVQSVDGINGEHFATAARVADAAVADGFQFFEGHPAHGRRKNAIACQWSACRVLREIADKDIRALVVEDDYMFRENWEGLQPYFEAFPSGAVGMLGYQPIDNALTLLNLHWYNGPWSIGQMMNIYNGESAAACLAEFGKGKYMRLEQIVGESPHVVVFSATKNMMRTSPLQGFSGVSPERDSPDIELLQRWRVGRLG